VGKRLRVLVACEFSGIVRDAFSDRGHYALSCDLLPSETQGRHRLGNVRSLLVPGAWDLLIAHPPCTHLAISGARYFAGKEAEQEHALRFVRALMAAPIPRICIENPKGMLSTWIRKPDQIIHPWQFGHIDKKGTCLWLKGLPLLSPTKVSWIKVSAPHQAGQTKDRWKDRSRTYKGIAQAMAEQWGGEI